MGKKLLIVVDMQDDFITGALGSPQAQQIVPNVQAKIEEYNRNGNQIVFTRDTHQSDYLMTQEGRCLPVPHCIENTDGHLIHGALNTTDCSIFDKPNFGSIDLIAQIVRAELCLNNYPSSNFSRQIMEDKFEEIEFCGLCSDICVVSNVLIFKAQLPEIKISVDAKCCAGVTVESHKAALLVMKMCQVNVINEV